MLQCWENAKNTEDNLLPMRTEKAYAKINLYLDVVSKRENGYHNLVSIMQTLSLCDTVTLEYLPADQTTISLSAIGNAEMPTDRRNLAWRAAELFLTEAKKTGEVKIFIEKQIPMAAGLAGGSADAAAVLRGLNALCDSPLSLEVLCALGARLGADVPFCIVGGMALVTGIGEKLRYLSPMQACPMVVACQGEGVSTVWAYGKLDEKYGNFEAPKEESETPEKLAELLAQGDFEGSEGLIFNLFEEVVPAVQPCVEPLKRTMLEHGAIASMMSGSGPSVFGIFKSLADAEKACTSLQNAGAAAFVCAPCGKYEN